ncbi:hypothetical protein Tco_0988744 [Tanacetum coccineum]|uniref:Uncharacterized protein n=1 Tax=Tanacetum coccineum TaxID=301880 RepID=A0ABQ5ERW0_9ASTR
MVVSYVQNSEGADVCSIDKIVVEVEEPAVQRISMYKNVLEEEFDAWLEDHYPKHVASMKAHEDRMKLQALEDIEWDKEFGMILDKVVEVKSDESADVVSVLTEDILSNPIADDEAESFECDMDCIKETKIDSKLILKHESDYLKLCRAKNKTPFLLFDESSDEDI